MPARVPSTPNSAPGGANGPVARPVPPPVTAAQAFDMKRRMDAIERARQAQQEKNAPAKPKAPVNVPKVDRNDPCPCGSGKKYKKCHGTSASGEEA
jgi:preprotein translocase subunit SecA